jgi:hypothetical protein
MPQGRSEIEDVSSCDSETFWGSRTTSVERESIDCGHVHWR